MAKERTNNILSSTYREILQARIEMINKLPRYVLIHDLEREDMLYLFTQKWENNKGEDIISNVLATIMDYIKEIDVSLKEDNNVNLIKIMTGQFLSTFLSEAYFLKLLISINTRNKLGIELPDEEYINSILPFVYAESKMKKIDSDKLSK